MSEPTYTLSTDGTAITCQRCGRTSYHPMDVANRYCGNCKLFHDEIELRRELGDGRAIWLVPQIYTFLLCIGAVDDMAYDDQWEYQDIHAALTAFALWDPAAMPEPVGWYRHHRTGRRRSDGDPSKEYVHF